MKNFFIMGSFFWHSRTIRTATQGKKSKLIKSRGLPKKTRDRDLAARSPVIGYGGLVIRIAKKIVKIISMCLAILNFNIIPKQRTKLLISAAKLPLKLKICRFRLSVRNLDW